MREPAINSLQQIFKEKLSDISTRHLNTETVLTFKSFAEALKIVSRLKQMSEISIAEWEEAHKFVSMRSLYSEFEDAVQALGDCVESQPQNKWCQYEDLHSNLVEDYQSVLTKVEMYDGVYYNINIYNRDLSYIINKRGLIICGGATYCLTANSIKIMNGDNHNNFIQLINAQSSVPQYGIVVIKPTSAPTPVPNPVPTSCSLTGGWVISDLEDRKRNGVTFRSIMYFTNSQSGGSQQGFVTTSYKVRIVSLRRFAGVFWSDKADIIANWNIFAPDGVDNYPDDNAPNYIYVSMFTSRTDEPVNTSCLEFDIPFKPDIGNDIEVIKTRDCQDPIISAGSYVRARVYPKKNNTSFYIPLQVTKV
jgi:hypothetical protein